MKYSDQIGKMKERGGCFGRLGLVAMLVFSAATSFAASLVTDLGGGAVDLRHRWRFDGNFADEIGAWNAYITNWNGGSASGWSFGSDHVDLNNSWDDKWSSQATYVRLPNNIVSNLATQGSSAFTFEMWVNTDDGHWNSGYMAFAKENGDGGDGNPRLAWTSYENDYFKVSWRQSAGGYWHQMHSPENLIPPMSGFQHLVLVVTENPDVLKVYVDGVFKGASSGLAAWEGPGLDTANWWNGIGGYLGIAPENEAALDGKIYDFRIWARALTDAEITQSYNLGSEVPTGQPTLSIAKLPGGQIELKWPFGTLLEATNVLGSWSVNPVTSPYTNTPSGNKFFRVRVP